MRVYAVRQAQSQHLFYSLSHLSQQVKSPSIRGFFGVRTPNVYKWIVGFGDEYSFFFAHLRCKMHM